MLKGIAVRCSLIDSSRLRFPLDSFLECLSPRCSLDPINLPLVSPGYSSSALSRQVLDCVSPSFNGDICGGGDILGDRIEASDCSAIRCISSLTGVGRSLVKSLPVGSGTRGLRSSAYPWVFGCSDVLVGAIVLRLSSCLRSMFRCSSLFSASTGHSS